MLFVKFDLLRKEFFMVNIMKSLIVITAMLTITVSATRAYFLDTERSIDNLIDSGTLDLKIDQGEGRSGDSNIVKFFVPSMMPGDSEKGTWTLKNAGSIDGYLDLHSIFVTNRENGCSMAEDTHGGGDTTCDNPGPGQGELQNVTNLSLFLDANNDGVFNSGDTAVYNGRFGAVAGSYDTNFPLAAGSELHISAIISWPSSGDDNIAQGDSVDFGILFELGQTIGQ